MRIRTPPIRTILILGGIFVAGCIQQPSMKAPNQTAVSRVNTDSKVSVSLDSSSIEVKPDLTPRPTDWFEDVTSQSGVAFTYRNGREAGRYFMIESFGGGVAAIDYDVDSDCDLFVTGGGTISTSEPVMISGLPAALFRNAGDWQFVNVSQTSGISSSTDYSQGCTYADYDLDGFPDLFVCCYGKSRLFKNLGDGTFHETEIGNSLRRDWATSAVFADFDRDGLSDLFVTRYTDWTPDKDVKCFGGKIRDLCGPTSYDGTTCVVLRNMGDGVFEDRSHQFGIEGTVRGLGILAADLNIDGLVDFYVASDVTANQLYLGKSELPLINTAEAAGVAVNEWGQPEASMGLGLGDYNGDGLPDIWITNFEKEDNALYRNLGRGAFLYSTASSGLAGVSRMRVGFGTALADFDADGRPDLFVLNGNPIYEIAETPFKQNSQLFRNLGERFEDVSSQGGAFFREPHSGRGNAVVDLDDDGALDIVTVQMNDPVRILRNRKRPANFIRVQLVGRSGEPEATGAIVKCKFQGRQVTQFAARGVGFFSQSDPRMIFPVTESEDAIDVTVVWPGRKTETFRGLKSRQTHLLMEGRGEWVHE